MVPYYLLKLFQLKDRRKFLIAPHIRKKSLFYFSNNRREKENYSYICLSYSDDIHCISECYSLPLFSSCLFCFHYR